ncbi:MAG TPA: tetratricopeptide repeat protein [Pyrinomonadaceae bacterium]|nr:tetratricopeptide repeat protein [Pyrinomonadaceae bacterium]
MRRSALSLATLMCLLFAAQAAQAKDTWTSVRSQNFFLVGNASEKDIRRVATRLEQFRDVFTRLFPSARFKSPVPTTVVVFKSDSSYKPFKPLVNGKPSDVAGYFQPGEDVNYITLTTEANGSNPFGTIYHEYVHLLVNNTLGSGATPPWFNEGLAEYYSAFDIEDDRKIFLGNLLSGHLALLRQQRELPPLKTLFEIDNYSLHRNSREAKGLFYAQSWALVHYLILGNGGRRLPQIGEFMALIGRNTPTEQAFRQAFQTDFATMEKELRDYVRQQSFRGQLVTLSQKLEFDQTLQAAPLTEAEAEAHLGDLLLHTDRPDDAEARLQKALALDPSLASAQVSLGVVRAGQKRFDEAKKHLRQAVAADPRDHRAHFHLANVLSREGMNEAGHASGYAPEAAAEMRASLRKAIELRPDFPESYRLLAWVNLVTGEQLDESVELLKRARTLSPGVERYALILAQIYMRQEKFDAARQTAEPLARTAPDPQTRAIAQSILQAVASMQEQLANFKAQREAFERAGAEREKAAAGGDRLNVGGSVVVAGKGSNRPVSEAEIADAFSAAIEQALRRPAAGETRVLGTLTRIECTAKGVVFHFQTGAAVLKLRANAGFEGLHLTAFTSDAGNELTCGPRKNTAAAVVTYTARADARAGTDGTLVALEFVPAEFRLKP